MGPVNIGSDEMVTINQLVDLVTQISEKKIFKKHIKGPEGVRGRNSENTLIKEKLNWSPTNSLKRGLEATYPWIASQIDLCQSNHD
jgi:nucleoside-diphosphate-sugar epimerase